MLSLVSMIGFSNRKQGSEISAKVNVKSVIIVYGCRGVYGVPRGREGGGVNGSKPYII